MIKKFEDYDNITIYNVAWLYMLYIHREMIISMWENDTRMGVGYVESLEKFDCVKYNKKHNTYQIDDGYEKYFSIYFPYKNFEDVIKYKYKDDNDNVKYPLKKIPYDLYLITNNNVEKSFDLLDDMSVDHFNSQTCSPRILNRILKMRNLGKWNYKNIMDIYGGDIPDKIILYRGLKDKYKPKNGFSCWTTELKEAKRFSKYVFTGGYQSPIYAKYSEVVEIEVKYSDIKMVIGGTEKEIIMFGDVTNYITNIYN